MVNLSNKNLKENTAYSAINSAELRASAPTIGIRHLQCFLWFIILLIAYAFRVILSVAIVAMTDPSSNENPNIPTYPEWTKKSIILSAFLFGYVFPQIFAGYAAVKFGAKWFLIVTGSTQSIIGFFTPQLAAQFGENGVILGRALQGFCQGFIFPSITHLVGQWVPKEERARLTNYAFGAVPLGTVLGLWATGEIAASSYGWPMAFYLCGVLGVLSFILFAFFGYNTPMQDPRISEAEKNFIQHSLGHSQETTSKKIPWKSILTSGPLLALFVTQCGYLFGFWTLLSQTPTYMKYVLNFDIKSNSRLSSLPYLLLFVATFPVSYLSDFIINKGILSQTTTRKWCNSLGTILQTAPLIMICYVDPQEPMKAVFLLIFSITCNCFSLSGWGINHLDLSTNHAGFLMGLCNGLGNILSFAAPLSVQFLVHDETDATQWRKIFYLAAGLQFFTGIIFHIFGSAERQPWDNENEEEEDEEKSEIKNCDKVL